VADRRPRVSERERLERGEDVGRRGVHVDPQPREPRQESHGRGRARRKRGAARLRVRPEDPQQLRGEREDARVVAVHRAGRRRRVDEPPAAPAAVDGDEQRERRQQHESDHQRIAARLGRVEDEERRQCRQDRGHERRAPSHGAHADGVDERDRGGAGEQRGKTQQLGFEADARRQPRQHERERRRDLRIGVHHRDHAPQVVRGDDPVRRQLVRHEAVADQEEPQREPDDRDQGDARDGHPRGRHRPGTLSAKLRP
jgi:hypothetical protein